MDLAKGLTDIHGLCVCIHIHIHIYIYTCATNLCYSKQMQANQLTMNSMETLISEVRHGINLFCEYTCY